MTPTLNGIDHVHVLVANREAAAEWYRDTLGLVPVSKFASWAENNGPLVISDPNGSQNLALFERPVIESLASLAFRADGKAWLQWIDTLQQKGIDTRLANHDLAYSLYFSDPDGNQLEITTYDVEVEFPA